MVITSFRKILSKEYVCVETEILPKYVASYPIDKEYPAIVVHKNTLL